MATIISQQLSRTVWTADGVTTSWNFAFSGGYLDPSHVKARSTTPSGVVTTRALTLIGPYQASIVPAVPFGDTLTIYRDTPRDLPLVDYTDGAGFSEASLDITAKQAVFLAAEISDGSLAAVVDDAVVAAAEATAAAASASASAIAAAAALGTITAGMDVVRFSGNGSQTVFTLPSAMPDSDVVDVYISGVYQQKDTFTAAGTTLTFSTAPQAGTDNIEVKLTIVAVVVGEQGPEGPPGPQGDPGPQGPPGVDGTGAGTVTSVAMSVPTGLSVAGSPITSAGTLTVTLTAGYSIPTTANQTNWSTAYGWGNHGAAGYLLPASIGVTVQAYNSNLTTWAGKTAPAGAVGTQEILQNSQSAAYTLVLADSAKHLLHPSADTTARTFTIPANSSVAYPIGTALTFVNQNGAGVLTIAINTDTMRLAGAGTTGSRTLAANGLATALKITATEWIISGAGLT